MTRKTTRSKTRKKKEWARTKKKMKRTRRILNKTTTTTTIEMKLWTRVSKITVTETRVMEALVARAKLRRARQKKRSAKSVECASRRSNLATIHLLKLRPSWSGVFGIPICLTIGLIHRRATLRIFRVDLRA